MNLKILKNQKGQALVESILIMLIFLGLFSVVVETLNANDFLHNVTREPWRRLDNMVRTGEWTESTGHPGLYKNHLSLRGDEI